MAINKVVINKDGAAQTLIDLSNDSVGVNTLVDGAQAHNRAGEIIKGKFAATAESDVNTTNNGGNLVSAEILNGKTVWLKSGKVTGTMPNNSSWEAPFISSKDQSIEIPEGYHSSRIVQIDQSVVADLAPENIRIGKSVLGVDGTMSGDESMKAQNVTGVKASFDKTVVVRPDKDYNCLGSVSVLPVSYREIEAGMSAGNMYGTTVIIGHSSADE